MHRSFSFALFFLTAVYYPEEAEAEGIACPSLQSVAKNVKNCGQNALFAQAAQECLERLKKEKKNATDQLTQTLRQNQANLKSAQNAPAATAAASLEALQASVTSLLQELYQAHEDIAGYSKSFVWPGGLSAAAVASLQLKGTFYQFACFGDAQVALSDMRNDLDHQMQDLAHLASAAGLLASQDLGTVRELQGTPGTVSADRVETKEKTPVKVKPPVKDGNSAVTGTYYQGD